MTTRKYIVVNPRNTPAGVHIFRIGDAKWFEGDEYVPDKNLKEVKRRGFVKEEK